MHSFSKQNKIRHRKGDIDINAVTKIKRCYDGNKWRRLCSIQQCERIAQLRNLCMRHFKECDLQQHSEQNMRSSQELPNQLSMDDFFMVVPDQNDFHNNCKLFLSLRYYKT
jgi:hypothetical protein